MSRQLPRIATTRRVTDLPLIDTTRWVTEIADELNVTTERRALFAEMLETHRKKTPAFDRRLRVPVGSSQMATVAYDELRVDIRKMLQQWNAALDATPLAPPPVAP